MRKLLAVLLLLLMPMVALAEEAVSVCVPGMEVVFTPPSGTVCVTRDTSVSEFGRWGLSQRDVLAFMEEYGVQALIFDMGTGAQYQISVYEWDAVDYDRVSEFGAQGLCTDTRMELEEAGAEVTRCETFRHDGHRFVHVEYSLAGDERMVCHTSHLGNMVSIFANIPQDTPAEYRQVVQDAVRTRLLAMADSLQCRAAFEAPGVTVTVGLPEDEVLLTRYSSRMAFADAPKGPAEIASAEEMTLSDVYGHITGQDGTWAIDWYIFEDGSGLDLRGMSLAEVTALCEETKALYEETGAVTLAQVYSAPGGRYLHLCYQQPAGDGTVWYNEEYTTIRDGWMVMALATSYEGSMPQEASALLQKLIGDQVITKGAQ